MELAETQKEEIEQAAKWWLLLTEVRTEIETMMMSLLKGRREFQHIRGHLQADADKTGMCEGQQEAERHRGERRGGSDISHILSYV